MNNDYISYIRSKVGHDKVILNFAGGILADEDGRVLLQLRGDNFDESYPNGDKVQTVVFLYEFQAPENVDIINFHNEETLRLGFFSKEEIAELENVSDKHRLMLDEYFSDSFAMGL